MNLGLVTSFVVAGVLMLSIVSLNTRMAESSAELTLRFVIEERAQTIERMLKNDIPRIGNDVHTRINSPIRDARKDMIKFKSNIDNTGAVETVTWEYTEDAIEGSSNPDDSTLYREVDGDRTTFASGVTDFEFTYLSSKKDTLDISLISGALKDQQDERDNIKFIEIKFTVETEELIGGAGASNATYLETNWKKKFPVYNQIN